MQVTRVVLLLVAFAINCEAQAEAQTEEICDVPIDLVFALDASQSITKKGFDKIKEFTKSIINHFKVDTFHTHVGILKFSEVAEVEIKLDDSFDKQDLYDRIDKISFPGYRTATDDALRVANKDMFSLSGGARQGVSQVLILINDGKCTVCNEDVISASAPLKARGISIFCIGISKDIDKNELLSIASEPAADHYFYANSTEELPIFISKLYKRTCEAKKGKCAVPLKPFSCKNQDRDNCVGDNDCPGVDKCCFNGCVKQCKPPLLNCLTPVEIALAFDSSSSIGESAYDEMKKFAHQIVDSFSISQQNARFAALVYGSNASIEFNFVRYDSDIEVKQAIQSLPYLKSKTRIDKALEIAKSDLFSLQGKVRSRRPMILLVFFDGTVTRSMTDLETVSQPLKDYGVKIIAVGVGPEVNRYQLKKIAEDNAIFSGNSFQDLVPLLYSVAEQSCSGKPGKCDSAESEDPDLCAGVVDECSNDFDCFGESKCCKKGCKKSCIPKAGVCPRKVDVAFALHLNMDAEEFEIAKFFLKSAIDRFNINKNGAHAALLTFGPQTDVIFDFKSGHTSNADLKLHIDDIKFNKGKGELADVFGKLCDAVFCVVGGTRDEVPKLVFLVVGQTASGNENELEKRVQTLRSRGVDVVVLAIGHDLNLQLLQSLTSTDQFSENRVWLSREYIDTLQYVQDVADFACGEAGELPPIGPLVEKSCGGQPNVCYRGLKGSRGRPGSVGPRGEPGILGPIGPAGIDGPKGAKGADGVMGAKGYRGEPGLDGFPGFPGYDGIPGVPGIEGRMGLDGDCGLPGSSGEAGPPGLNGFGGPPGRPGPTGKKGQKGMPTPDDPNLVIFPGEAGDRGEAGPIGFKGNRGGDGPKGDVGDDGSDGVQGLKGEEGEMGETGNLINVKGQKGYRGSPGPAGPLFEAGTITDNEGMAGEVGTGGPIGEKGDPGDRGESSEETGRKGQQGPQGAQGEVGSPGPAGPKGLKGVKGEMGREGGSGENGEKGQDGRKGEKGPEGEKGEIGDKGKLGPQGFDGKLIPGEKGLPGQNNDEVGNPGRDGPAGEQGPPGVKGQPGPSQPGTVGDRGSVGPRGPRGSSGTAGGQGFQGDTGPDGLKGVQGPRGDEGKNGDLIAGKPGMIGPPGQKGVQGPTGDTGPEGIKGEISVLVCSEGKCPKGEKGVLGAQGNVGLVGPPGINGSQGLKGFKGGPCPLCPPGDQGPSGETGSPGRPGEKGGKGDQGELGASGEKGKRGIPGAIGKQGPKGKAGIQGDPGAIGDKGDTGPGTSVAPKGEQGLSGADGKPGDRGPPGVKGIKGFKGQAGAAGKRGSDGKKGAIGLTGESGLDGMPGTPGSPGDKGDGEIGMSGEKGSDGRIGDQGPIGDSGPDGVVGEPGAGPTEEELIELRKKIAGEKGVKGDQGQQGLSGPVGETGPKGPRGLKGTQGSEGPKGYGGIPGDKGEPGRNGDDGNPGLSGFPGSPGKRGDSGENGLPGPDGITERGEKGKEGEPGLPGKIGEDAIPAPGCFTFGDPTDIAFILDSSSSVTSNDFNRQKEFVKTILGQFPLGPELTQAGIIKYGHDASIEINFGDFFTELDLFNAINKISHSKADKSRLDLALKMAHEELFAPARGARGDHIEKAIVILGDGYISGGDIRSRVLIESAKTEAAKLRDLGVLIIAIGVGAEPNKFLLQNFVSKPEYYLKVSNYSQLVTKIGDFQAQISSSCLTPGEPGRDGSPGIKGPKGENGTQGEDGDSPRGLQGPKGIKGEKGNSGVGIKGLPGADGPVGAHGENGIPGKDGLSIDGTSGLKGAQGEPGDNLKGEKGVPGKVGDTGLPGVDTKQILCDKVLQTDILFLLDTSGSVGLENFDKMKDFVKSIIMKFDVDNQMSRVGILTFDSDAEILIKLSDHNSLKNLLSEVDSIRYSEGTETRIDKALSKAMEAFSEQNGGRADANKALVLLADGQQSFTNDSVALEDAVKPLIGANVLRYVIGIGLEVDLEELNIVASSRVNYADNFDELNLKIEDQISYIAKRGCQGPPGQPGKDGAPGQDGKPGADGPAGISPRGEQGSPGLKGKKGMQGEAVGDGAQGDKGDRGDEGPVGFPGCTNEIGELGDIPTDLAFALDASASLLEDGFQKEKDFIKNVLDQIGALSSSGVRVGVITYSDDANIRIRFDYSFDKETVKKEIDRIPYDSKSTRIDLGLEVAKELFLEKNGGRGSSKKVLILLADGQQTYVPDGKDPADYAKELAAYGVDIFAIGIGDEINEVDLKELISKPQHIFLSADISSLIKDLSKDISTALSCEGGPRGPVGQAGDDGPPGSIGPQGEAGKKGLKGDQGDPGLGPKGDTGDRGLMGKQGDVGEKGFRGLVGPNGAQGLRGPKGFPGPKGPQGDPGFPGLDGNKGQQGPIGLKGSKGNSADKVGAAGEVGDKGEPGLNGDPGELPPGSVIGDLDGQRGPIGPKGEVGGPGRPGKVLIAPGPIGLYGSKGEKGESGLFGNTGEEGQAGKNGTKGERGDVGQTGQLGEDGPPGKQGETGEKGEEGNEGISQKGEQGELGKPGQKGEQGPQGDEGFIGFFGMPGAKGDRGEQGPPGKQQTQDDTVRSRAPKGIRGEKGYSGDFGEQGQTGEPGVAIGAQGQRGEKGLDGPKGAQGDRGDQGNEGLKGFPGRQGSKGKTGDSGAPGEQGPAGPEGIIGERIGGSEKGDIGNIGLIGLKGRKGAKGQRGEEGIKGNRGPQGSKGVRGSPGFEGLQGDPGPLGPDGKKGQPGGKGLAGETGFPGPPGPSGIAEGFYIVRHSLSSFIPKCPRNYKMLWSGYSLMYTVGNGQAHGQDLGTAGSCVKAFSTLPFLFCGISGKCKYASRNDFVYWLSGSEKEPDSHVNNVAIEPYISRCAVCEAPSTHIAVHSQDAYKPDCPINWEPLWDGYSFLMVGAAGNTGAGQSLSSSGSCLELFRPKPLIECQGSGGTCNFFADKYSFWLKTIDPKNQFQTEPMVVFSESKGDVLNSRVSTCQVCVRSQGSIGKNIVEP